MKKKILVRVTELENITIELDDTSSPKTCASFLKSLPFQSPRIFGERKSILMNLQSPGLKKMQRTWLILMTLLIGPMEKQYVYFLVLRQSVKKER